MWAGRCYPSGEAGSRLIRLGIQADALVPFGLVALLTADNEVMGSGNTVPLPRPNVIHIAVFVGNVPTTVLALPLVPVVDRPA